MACNNMFELMLCKYILINHSIKIGIKDTCMPFFFYFYLLTDSKVGSSNLLLRHSTVHFTPKFRDILCYVVKFTPRFVLLAERGNEIYIFKILKLLLIFYLIHFAG